MRFKGKILTKDEVLKKTLILKGITLLDPSQPDQVSKSNNAILDIMFLLVSECGKSNEFKGLCNKIGQLTPCVYHRHGHYIIKYVNSVQHSNYGLWN